MERASSEVVCLLCDRPFRVLGRHLRGAHGIDVFEYRQRFLGAQTICEDLSRELSRGQLGNKNALGHVVRHTEEAKQLMREYALGKQYALGCRHTEEANRRMRESVSRTMLGNQNALGNVFVHTEEELRRMSEVLKELWKDPEYAKRVAEGRSRKPSGPELQLWSVLDRHFPGDWKYVGDNQFGIEGRYPDFVNVDSKKQVIEIFGYYWHDPILFPNRMSEEELIAYYKKFGFDCIVFWEYDVYNEEEVVGRIRKEFGRDILIN